MPGTNFEKSYERSLARTLMDLHAKGVWFSFIMLGFFSVIVPSVKLVAILCLILQLLETKPADVYEAHPRLICALTYFASYQLIDLYVGILFGAFFNSDSADCRFLEGFYWFFSYCIVSLFASELLAGAFPQFEEEDKEDDDALVDKALPDEEVARPSAPGQRPLSPMGRNVQRQRSRADSETSSSSLVDRSSGSASRSGSKEVPKSHAPHGPEYAGYTPYGRGGGSKESPALEATRESTLLEPVREAVVEETPTPRYASFAFPLIFVILVSLFGFSPMLEVRTLWKGVAVDRCSRSMMEILGHWLPLLAGQPVVIVVLLMNVFLPLCYVLALAGRACSAWAKQRWPDGRGVMFAQVCSFLVCHLRPWVTTDVFVFASWVYLFTVRDQQTLTMKPEGSHVFDCILVAGMAFFFLRWFVGNTRKYGARLLVAAWALLCLSSLGGIWLQELYSPKFDFPTLDSVCKTAMPLLNNTARQQLPASYGACDKATRPPQPCQGGDLLLNQTNTQGFIQAVWLGGINTVNLDSCRLWRSVPNVADLGNGVSSGPPPKTRYHMKISGIFKKIRLFLDLKQCGPWGCTTMDSPDHCCGDDIRFHLTIGMDCRPGRGLKSFEDVLIEDCDVDPMIVEQDFLGGALHVDALDISPMVEKVVTQQIEKFIGGTKLEWAGQRMSIPDLLNRLISYNAPSAVGYC